MSMSKAVRRQVIGADLILGAVATIRKVFRGTGNARPPERLDALLTRCEEQARIATRIATGDKLTDEDRRAYERHFRRLRDVVLTAYGHKVDAREFLTVALGWIEDVREQLPDGDDARRAVWDSLALAASELYAVYDRDGDDLEQIEAGDVAYGKIKDAMGVWA